MLDVIFLNLKFIILLYNSVSLLNGFFIIFIIISFYFLINNNMSKAPLLIEMDSIKEEKEEISHKASGVRPSKLSRVSRLSVQDF